MYQEKLIDLLLSKDEEQALSFLSPSILPQRFYLDSNYERTSLIWGDGYPRPLSEMAGSQWESNAQSD